MPVFNQYNDFVTTYTHGNTHTHTCTRAHTQTHTHTHTHTRLLCTSLSRFPFHIVDRSMVGTPFTLSDCECCLSALNMADTGLTEKPVWAECTSYERTYIVHVQTPVCLADVDALLSLILSISAFCFAFVCICVVYVCVCLCMQVCVCMCACVCMQVCVKLPCFPPDPCLFVLLISHPVVRALFPSHQFELYSLSELRCVLTCLYVCARACMHVCVCVSTCVHICTQCLCV